MRADFAAVLRVIGMGNFAGTFEISRISARRAD
jgi:hypothetical protein